MSIVLARIAGVRGASVAEVRHVRNSTCSRSPGPRGRDWRSNARHTAVQMAPHLFRQRQVAHSLLVAVDDIHFAENLCSLS